MKKVKKFIGYINSQKMSINKYIEPSIYETNSLLFSQNPSMIKYDGKKVMSLCNSFL